MSKGETSKVTPTSSRAPYEYGDHTESLRSESGEAASREADAWAVKATAAEEPDCVIIPSALVLSY